MVMTVAGTSLSVLPNWILSACGCLAGKLIAEGDITWPMAEATFRCVPRKPALRSGNRSCGRPGLMSYP